MYFDQSVLRAAVFAAMLGTVGGTASIASGDVQTFIFAEVGTTYTGFFFPDNPFVGQEVMLTRIFLEVDVAPGADAAGFDTDITFPLRPFDGNRNALGITGADLGWSGSGRFTYMFETTEFNGVFISTLFGAATGPLDAVISKSSRIEMVTVPTPASAVLPGIAGLGRIRRRR
jgi:hypothetical protein